VTATSRVWPRRPAHRPWQPALTASLITGLLAGAAQAAPFVYVSSEKDNALTVLDLATQSVQGTIPTCKRPRHLQLTPDRTRLLAICSDSDAADIIDLATRKSVGRIPLGEDPEVVDLSPDGKLIYISHEDDGELGIVEAAGGKRIANVKVGQEPEGVKVAPDGKTVYVTSEVANLVHVVDVSDPAKAKVVKNVKVGKRPRRFALTPDGSELWVTNEMGASVSILSTRDYSVLATLEFKVPGARADDITPVGIAMTRDGKRGFVALGRANHVAFVDVAARKVTQLVLVGKRAWNVALDQPEAKLLVVNGLSDDLTVVDVAAAKALKTIPVGRVPYMAVVVD
jgi:PQQ-dependent catabolism-associated beta-propeller protein